MSTLEGKSVVKVYEGSEEPAVKGINFRVEDGEFIAILGPSGCGKSSTLRMIAGLEEITSGEILIGDKAVNDLSPAQRNIALAFESYALYAPMSVYENIAFPLKAAKQDKSVVEKRVMEIAEMFELEPFLKKKPSALSGGQQQRVSLARALVRRPNIFLLDEPLSHMDQRSRADIRSRIKYMHNQEKITTIYVTHDQEEAVSLADRVLVMSDGEIQQFGEVDELWNRPANLFVAGFIGEPAMNFIDGRASGVNSVTVGDAKWNCATALSSLPKNSPVVVGFRPNKTALHTSPTEGGLSAVVTVVEFVGTERQVTVDIENENYRVMIPADEQIAPGQKVFLTVEPENVGIFDKNTGLAL